MTAIAVPEGRIQGLDGIRGAAAFFVVLYHTAIITTHLGDVSVYMFFELSGLLIFGILAKSRAVMESGHSTGKQELIRFWTNRAMRIFPVYYITLFTLYIADSVFPRFHDLRHDFPWYLTYTQNFLVAFETKSWGSFTHTWSLAVEQQFYVVFALIFLLIPLRRYGVTLLLLFAICLLAIWGLASAHFGEITLYTLPFGGFLFIIAGGAVGLFRRRIAGAVSPSLPVAECLAWGLVVAMAFLSLLPKADGIWSPYFPVPILLVNVLLTGLMAAFLWLVVSFPRLSIVKMLETRLLVFLGSISYALYVFHQPVALAASRSLIKYSHYLPHGFAALLTVAASIGLSYLSLKFIEQPIANWKKYRRGVAAASGMRAVPVKLDGAADRV